MLDFSLALNPKTLSASDVGNLVFDYFKSLQGQEDEPEAYDEKARTIKYKDKKRPTIAGLALVLNMTPKRLFTYVDNNITSTDDDEQIKAQIISRALAFIAEHYEEGGDTKKNATFNWNILKALGYPEKTTIDHNVKGESLSELAFKAKKQREIEKEQNKITTDVSASYKPDELGPEAIHNDN